MRIFIFILFSFSLQAQQPFSYKLDYEKGFESNEVYEIEQDSFGFVWIGCDAGIFRYDGVYFKQYVHPKQNGVSISNLIIDEQQRIWCQNFTGQIFYIQNDTIHLFKDFTKETSAFPKFDIEDDNFTVVLPENLLTYDIDSKREKSKILSKDTESNPLFIVSFLTIQDGSYVNSRDNIYFQKDNNRHHKLFKSGEYICHNLKKINGTVYTILQKNKTQEWIFAKLDKGKIVKSKVFLSTTFSNGIYMIKPFRDGFILCTTNGVYLLDKSFNLLYHYFSNGPSTVLVFFQSAKTFQTDCSLQKWGDC